MIPYVICHLHMTNLYYELPYEYYAIHSFPMRHTVYLNLNLKLFTMNQHSEIFRIRSWRFFAKFHIKLWWTCEHSQRALQLKSLCQKKALETWQKNLLNKKVCILTSHVLRF